MTDYLRDSADGYKLSVSLDFLGEDIDPDIVTQLTEISPSRSWRVGDRPTARVNGWELKVCSDGSVEIDECMERLKAVVEPKLNRFSLLPDHYRPQLSVSLSCYSSETPSIYFDHSHLRWLSLIRASIDVDVTVYTD